VRTEIPSEKLKGKDQCGHLKVDGYTILKFI